VDPYAEALAAAVDASLAEWVVRCVQRRAPVMTPDLLARARGAGEVARTEVGARLRTLLETDIDEQRVNPLALLRAAVRYPTDVLAALGVPPVPRDEFAVRAFPDDPYDLSPATWADIDERLREPGLAWGAWKAKQHLDRRRAGGAP